MSMPRDPYPLAPPTLPTPAKPPTQAISPSPSSSVGMEESTDDEVGVPVMPSPAPQNGVTEIVVCYGEYEMLVTFNMEVETRFGKVSFSDEVATALKEALSTEFTVCETPSRRKRRLVETPISIGSVRVLDSAGKQVDRSSVSRLDSRILFSKVADVLQALVLYKRIKRINADWHAQRFWSLVTTIKMLLLLFPIQFKPF